MPWRWNPLSGRYHHVDGKQYFLSRETALSFVEQSLAAAGNATDKLAELVADGLLSPADWRSAMREEIKREYIRQYTLGKGGLPQMTQADWGSIGGMLKEQYGHLDDFVKEIAQGKLTEGQIAARARMYTNSAREGYERARSRVASALGFDEVAWVLGIVMTEHCPDCEAWAKLGFLPVASNGGFPAPGFGDGVFPGDGNSVCLTNCACSLVYRNSVTGEDWEG